MMQQNRDRNGRPRNPRPYDLNRDVARTSAPSQDHTPRSTGSSRYGYNGEPLSRPPSRSANGSVRSSRADNSIQFPTQTQSQPRRPAQGQGSNTTQYPAGNRPAGSRPKNAKSGGKQRRPANNARSGQSSRKNQNAQNRPNRQHPAGSQSAPQQSPARREMRKKRKVTRATLRRRRMLRRLTAFAMLLCVIGAGIYLTMTMLFRINSIQVQTPDGKQVTEIAGYSADSILQRMGVQLEENIFSFEPGEKAAVLEQNFPLLGSIKVIRDYPNTVVVQVTEAVPAYAVQNGNKWLVISDKWKILSEESTQPEGLCTLYGGKLQDTTPGQGFWFVDDADAASASGSDAYENWTDVPGIFRADPAIVPSARAIPAMAYDEVRELAYMGANVLHEDAVTPARRMGIPIHIRSTMQPDAPGTLVSSQSPPSACPVTGIAGRKGYCSIQVEKENMNSAVGYCRRILSVLETHEIPFDHIATGLGSISVIAPAAAVSACREALLSDISAAVRPDSICVADGLAMVSIVGRDMAGRPGVSGRLLCALGRAGINVRMVVQGTREINITVGISEPEYEKAVHAVHGEFFPEAPQ